MIFPYILLFSVPIFFSHIFLPFAGYSIEIFGYSFTIDYPIEIFGHIFWEHSSFERVKVILFFILVLVGILEVLIQKNHLFFLSIKKYGWIMLGLFLYPISVFLVSYYPENASEEVWSLFLYGSHEKYHGYFFYAAIILCTFLFTFIRHEKSKLIKTSLLGAGIVAIYSLLEYTHLWQIFPYNSTTWETGRTLSTLGNPNYVAGYLLLHLPLTTSIRTPERYMLFLLFISAIFTTGSFIGIVLMLVYVLWITLEISLPFIQKRFGKKKSWQVLIISFLSIFLCIGWGLSQKIDHDKWLSFKSRGILMADITSDMIHHPVALIFGNGPDSIILHYAGARSPILDLYFPRESNIDSSHNLFLDILFQYGIVILGYLVYLLYGRYKILNSSERASLLLFLVFFSFNIIIIAAISPILLILAYDRNQG